MVEIQVESGIPEGLLIAFSVMTTILISVHVFALMICLYFSKYWWCGKYSSTRHLNWMQFSSWKTSHTLTLHGIIWTGPGTLVFLAKTTILCWVKFYNHSKPVVVAASVVLVLVCIVFVWFAVHFYQSLVQHKYERSFQGEIFFNRLQTNCTQIQGQYQAHQQAVHVLIMGFEIICIAKPSVTLFIGCTLFLLHLPKPNL